jgi:formate/nitrite transporter FocA (FNT family)
MGMTLNVCGTLTSMAIAWMNTKAAPFGRMIARREFAKLDRTFFAALVQSAGAAVIACTGVWLITYWLTVHGHYIPHRLLPLAPLAFFLFATVGNIVVFAEALYLRAHKQEKFMINSIAGALYIAPIAWWMARTPGPHHGAWGIAAANAIGVVFIGLGLGTYTFLRWRRIWHAA